MNFKKFNNYSYKVKLLIFKKLNNYNKPLLPSWKKFGLISKKLTERSLPQRLEHGSSQLTVLSIWVPCTKQLHNSQRNKYRMRLKFCLDIEKEYRMRFISRE